MSERLHNALAAMQQPLGQLTQMTFQQQMQEAEARRQMAMERVRQQANRENTELAAELAEGREEAKWERESEHRSWMRAQAEEDRRDKAIARTQTAYMNTVESIDEMIFKYRDQLREMSGSYVADEKFLADIEREIKNLEARKVSARSAYIERLKQLDVKNFGAYDDLVSKFAAEERAPAPELGPVTTGGTTGSAVTEPAPTEGPPAPDKSRWSQNMTQVPEVKPKQEPGTGEEPKSLARSLWEISPGVQLSKAIVEPIGKTLEGQREKALLAENERAVAIIDEAMKTGEMPSKRVIDYLRMKADELMPGLSEQQADYLRSLIGQGESRNLFSTSGLQVP